MMRSKYVWLEKFIERVLESVVEYLVDYIDRNFVKVFIWVNRIDKLVVFLRGEYKNYPLCKELSCLCPVIAAPNHYFVEGANCCLVMYLSEGNYSFMIIKNEAEHLSLEEAIDILPDEMIEFVVLNLELFD